MRKVVTALFGVSLLVVGVAAQNQQPADQGQQPAAQSQQPAPQAQQPAPPSQPSAPQAQQPATRAEQGTTGQAEKVVMSGCIQNAPPEAPAAGAAPSTAAASKFDLASAKVVSGGPVGTAGGAASSTRYRLDGEEKTISTHLNQQVEITGTVSRAAGSGAAAAPMLKVDSVKMIAAKCP